MKKVLYLITVTIMCISLVATFSLIGCKDGEVAEEEVAEEEAPAEEEEEEAPAEEEEMPIVYSEAPMLAKLVEEGLLPPVEERLPENPKVEEGMEVGTYGGTVSLYGDRALFPTVPNGEMFVKYEPVISFEEDYSWAQPNIAESYELSEDGLTLTLNLKKGIKWSDGVEFTADDIMYCFEYEINNTEIFPVFPVWLTVKGEPVTATKIDDYTVQLNFPSPYAGMLNFLSHVNGAQVTDIWFGFFQPAHYMSQYHPDFIGMEEATAMAEELGFESWVTMYKGAIHGSVFGVTVFPDSPPVLNAFLCVERTTDRVKLQRNPYYWKVDGEGNQLPYIDEIVIDLITDVEAISAKIMAGEVDFSWGSIDNLPLYAENQEAGNYSIIQWKKVQIIGLEFNFTCKDEYLKELFNDIKFRQAISLALDRDEINSLFFLDLGEPLPYYCASISPYYEQDVFDAAMEYVRYDPEAAKALLAEIGLTETDADGYLLKSDGERLQIIFEYSEGQSGVRAGSAAMNEVLMDYLEDIGIELIPRLVTNPQYNEDVVNNDIQMSFANVTDGLEPFFTLNPHTMVPNSPTWANAWAVEWAYWLQTDGEEGEEPPQEIKDLYNLYEELKANPTEEGRIAAGQNIFTQMVEKTYKIGLLGNMPHIIILNNDIKNIPGDGWLFGEWPFLRTGSMGPYAYIEGASADTAPNPILYEGPPGLGNVE